MVLPKLAALVDVALDLHAEVDFTGTCEEVGDLLGVAAFGEHAAVGVQGSAPGGCASLQEQLYQVDAADLQGVVEGGLFVQARFVGVYSLLKNHLCDLYLIVDACVGKRRLPVEFSLKYIIRISIQKISHRLFIPHFNTLKERIRPFKLIGIIRYPKRQEYVQPFDAIDIEQGSPFNQCPFQQFKPILDGMDGSLGLNILILCFLLLWLLEGCD